MNQFVFAMRFYLNDKIAEYMEFIPLSSPLSIALSVEHIKIWLLHKTGSKKKIQK